MIPLNRDFRICARHNLSPLTEFRFDLNQRGSIAARTPLLAVIEQSRDAELMLIAMGGWMAIPEMVMVMLLA